MSKYELSRPACIPHTILLLMLQPLVLPTKTACKYSVLTIRLKSFVTGTAVNAQYVFDFKVLHFYGRLQKGLHDNASVYTAWSRLTFYWLTNKTNSRKNSRSKSPCVKNGIIIIPTENERFSTALDVRLPLR